MATLWPRTLPREVTENPLRAAEVKVYIELGRSLPSTFTVFYSRPWLGLTTTGAEIDGECDFAIVHPEIGLLALEVKGGTISYDSSADQWASRDRHGFTHKIKNPVSQARTAKHRLLQVLHKNRAWQPRRIRARHGVIFPDCIVPFNGLGADAPRELICSIDDFSDLRAWVLDRMGFGLALSIEENRLGPDGVAAMEDALARPFALRTPLGHRLEEDERALQALTPQQFHLLESIQGISRAGIAGAAGTGKTVLAIESAHRFADAGLKTLLMCHSQPLAADFERRLRGVSNLETGTFHELCLRLATRAGIRFEPNSSPAFFDEDAPELLLKSLEIDPSLRFDAIVVDEGQDFLMLWWLAVEAAVRPGKDSRLHIFYDSNQRVYSRGGRPPDDVELVPIRLTRNLRNTRPIHDAAMNHYDGFEILPNGLAGVAVEICAGETEQELIDWASRQIRMLTGSERVAPGDITVLTASRRLCEKLQASGRLGGALVTDAASPDEEAVTVDTVRRFKGLDSSLVLILATPDLANSSELAYVGLSRARTRLAACGSASSLESIFPELFPNRAPTAS